MRASSPLRALVGASFSPVGALWGPSWAVLEPSWEPLGPSWDDLWGLLGRLGQISARKAENPKNVKNLRQINVFKPFGQSWSVLEALRALGEGTGLPLAVLGPSWEHLAGLLPSPSPLRSFFQPSQAPLGALLGLSWDPLGPSWSLLGSLLGRLGTIFGTSWAVLGRSWIEKPRTLKTFKNLRKINVFSILRSFRGSTWKPLRPSRGPLGLS